MPAHRIPGYPPAGTVGPGRLAECLQNVETSTKVGLLFGPQRACRSAPATGNRPSRELSHLSSRRAPAHCGGAITTPPFNALSDRRERARIDWAARAHDRRRVISMDGGSGARLERDRARPSGVEDGGYDR